MSKRLRILFAALLIGLFPDAGRAAVIDFESIGDLESVSNQISGLTFTNATTLTAFTTLNEEDSPPSSGVRVVFDDGGPLSIVFDTPLASVGGYFTYPSALTTQVFDVSSNLLGTALSAHANNTGTAGEGR